MEHDLNAFLGVLCVEWGFCIPPPKAAEIASLDSVTATQFARLVLDAEGMNCETSPWFKKISKRFSDLFGEEIFAATYQSSWLSP